MKFCLLGGTSHLCKTPGGAEKQRLLLAKYLVEAGHIVYHLVPNHKADSVSKDGVYYPNTWKYGNGLPIIRYFTENLKSLKKAIVAISPDVTYTRGFSEYAPYLTTFFRKHRIFALAGLAHDRDINYELAKTIRGSSTLFSSIRFRFTFHRFQNYLGNCSLVIAQTDNQKEMLNECSIHSIVIKNIVEPALECLLKVEEDKDVIWIASIFKKKGPDKLLEIVKMLPEINFTIVGRLGDPSLSSFLDEISKMSNVVYLGFLDHAETLKEIAKHKIVINTSIAEGFSNVFLEAWSLRKPVVSLNVNPDNLLIGRESHGYCCCGDQQSMANIITALLHEPSKRMKIGNAGMDYVIKNHGKSTVQKLISNIHALRSDM